MITRTTAFRSPYGVVAAVLGVRLLTPAAHAQFYQPQRGTPVAPVSPEYVEKVVGFLSGDIPAAPPQAPARRARIASPLHSCR